MFKVTGKKKVCLDTVKKRAVKSKNLLVMLGILLAFLLGFLYLRAAVLYNSAESLQFVEYTDDFEGYDFYKVGDSITSEVVVEEEVLSGIQLCFDPVSGRNAGEISAYITDLDTKSKLYENRLNMSDLNENYKVDLMFEPSCQNLKGHTIQIVLEVLSADSKSDLKLEIKVQADASANVDFIKGVHTNKNSFTMIYAMYICIGLALFSLLFYCLVFIIKAKIETIFLVSILCLGFFYSFLITPYSKPDETVHIDNTYYFSNKLLGIKEIDEEHMYKRQTDIDVSNQLGNPPNRTTYRQIYEGLWDKADNTELVAVEKQKPYVVPIVYGPGILGVSLARVLNLNSLWMLMLGTWFNLIAFALLVYFGMKRLPFGKMLLFLIALMPMTIQQAASLSYDAVVNGIALFFTCYSLQLIYEKEKVRRGDVITISILSLLLCWGKGGAYVPLVFLIFLTPKKKFSEKRNYYVWIASILAILVAGFLTVSLSSFIATNGTSEKIVAWADSPGFTISDVIAHPKYTTVMLVNTFFFRGGHYIYTLVGESLGSLDIPVSTTIIFAYCLLLCLSAFREEGEKQYLTVGQKWYMGMISLGSIGLIVLSMLLDWTPKGYIFVEGVQGRYFIPLALVIFLLLRNNHLVYKRSSTKFFLCTFLIIQLAVVYTLIQTLM